MNRYGYALGMCLALLSVGCAKKLAEEPDAQAVAGESGKPGSAMAYTHNVTVDLAENQIAARLDSVREACSSGRHGSCAPNIHQSARVTAIAQITFAKSLLRLRRFVVHRITPFVRLGIMGLHGYL